MRADRLLSLMLLLQQKGRLTAEQLAQELEVSVRTVYRDVEALSVAGVPVYVERGPRGGVSLVEDYRTDLTGLSDDEVLALLMLSVPKPLASLDIGSKAKTALLKLMGASARPVWSEERRVRDRLYVDSTWWFQGSEPSPYLPVLQAAVWNDEVLDVTYLSESQDVLVSRPLEPYALVAKAGVWYLVYFRNRHRAIRVGSITEVSGTGQKFLRAPDFDLERFWEGWCSEYERTHLAFTAKLRVKASLIPVLRRHFGRRVPEGVPLGTETIDISLPFEGFSAARSQIMRYGSAVEVLEPQSLRMGIADYARQIMQVYRVPVEPASVEPADEEAAL